ncbi:MAG: cbb3-type cytochrome c oxidase subunit I [Chloroflexi bacterium]|nr:cbb3-type cytochrome c oxidase subunit I [Chloroflexota bacterium]MCC6895995.1 hypothetical protein [Anaerolineae bacterium]
MPRLSVWIIRTALLELGIGITIGTLMLWNKGEFFEARIWLLLTVHIELLIVGWLMQLALGVAFWILPRFTHEPRYGSLRRGWLGYGLLNVGILLVILAPWIPHAAALHPIGRLLEVLAAITFATALWPRVKAFGV